MRLHGGDVNVTITVKDMLKRPYFRHAKILAGKNGLHHEVKWAHIVEIARFGHLLNGNEVILTTGIGWSNDEEKSLHYLQQLLDYQAAALCVELVVHVKKLPQKMLELAEKHNFPIISFQEEVRFIDITKDLHELLIGVHEDIWWRLEQFHQKMQQALTTHGTVGDILRILHQDTNRQIALVYDEQFRFFPSPAKKQQQRWIETIQQNDFPFEPVSILNEQLGQLFFMENKQTITQFDKLALKRCSEMLAQYFWRHQKQLEVERMGRNRWILDAIYGTMSHEEIIARIRNEHPRLPLHQAIIGIKPYQTSLLARDQDIHSETSSIMFLRSVLADYGLQLLTVKDDVRNYYVLLVLHQFKGDFLQKLQQALHQVRASNDNLLLHNDLKWLSFGKLVTDLSTLPVSYETAISTLAYQQKVEPLPIPVYHQLTVYRLIDLMNNEQEITEIVEEYIDPLVAFDKEYNSELLKTLRVYLKNLGSKNKTAEELHIVRQTLYHRLQRIEDLLGKDFLEEDKRFMIEFSIHAQEFLKK